MANYINSSKINMFPVAGRSEDYSQSYLLSEKNLTETFRSFYQKDNSSFIISDKFEAPFKFIIDGRYFELTDLEGLSTTEDLFATIFVNNETKRVIGYNPENITTPFQETTLDDDSNNFVGLYLSNTIPADDSTKNNTRYTLKLLNKGIINNDAVINIITSIDSKIVESGVSLDKRSTLVITKTNGR